MTNVACSCCGETTNRASVQLKCHPDVVICSVCLGWLNAKLAKQVASAGGPVRIAGVEPIFGVADAQRAAAHYEQLGFTTDFHDDSYAFAHRDDLTIHLAQRDGATVNTVGALYLHVSDADRLADAWRKAGMQVDGPNDFDYGKREGSHTDPDGNLIRFGSPLGRST